jgi:hypothetical protein
MSTRCVRLLFCASHRLTLVEANTSRQQAVETPSTEHEPRTSPVRRQQGKTSRPVSFIYHVQHHPRSTTSVVKDLIGGGATLVYDSLTQENTRNDHSVSFQYPSDINQSHSHDHDHQQQQRKEHVHIPLTTTQLKHHLADHSPNTISTILTEKPCQSNSSQHTNTNMMNVESILLTNQQHESVSELCHIRLVFDIRTDEIMFINGTIIIARVVLNLDIE